MWIMWIIGRKIGRREKPNECNWYLWYYDQAVANDAEDGPSWCAADVRFAQAKIYICVYIKKKDYARFLKKLTRGLAPQYQDLTRCVRPPKRWDLQPPKPPPLSELLSSLPSSSSSVSRSWSRSLLLPLPIISASLPSHTPSLS